MSAGLFEPLDDVGIGLLGGESLLDERERRLVAGAANFHALCAPERILRFTVLRGPGGSYPSLTDEQCRRIAWREDRTVVGSMVLRSLVPATLGPATDGVVDRVIDLGGGEHTANTYDHLPGVLGQVRRKVRFAAPVQIDMFRQLRTARLEQRYRSRPLPRCSPVSGAKAAVPTPAGGIPAVIFGLHWLELGGAERWALESIKLAKQAGFTPIVITDRGSTHPWITHELLDDAVVIPLTQPTFIDEEPVFFGGLFSVYDVRGIHLHHCTWLYDRLPWIKSVLPDVPVVDSLHILEWRTGGFVDIAVRMSSLIDVHHVISPQLRDYLIGTQEIPTDKVKLATLATLTTKGIPHIGKDESGAAPRPFTVSYIGRFHQQKRPFLFLKLAAQLKSSAPEPIKFIMHGDGGLADEVRAMRTGLGLADVLELRGSDRPVADTFADSDVLVVTSENEGLTLTSFEATAAGIPVVSTDVGSQASVVANGLLCPRHTYPFIHAATARIKVMMSSSSARKTWLDEQAVKTEAFAKLPDATTWTRDLYQGWVS
jgi:glycosyltransferase involved in cell wall biosynthesis